MKEGLAMLAAVWQVVLMMAPYLLFGFAVAGALSLVLTPAWVVRHLGRRGLWQVVKAALLGVPLPLCSCGVLPLAFSLRRDGASKGATVSFLASTPQTGEDSILLTYSLLGPVFAAARVAAAFASGVLAGVLANAMGGGADEAGAGGEKKTCCCCCGKAEAEEEAAEQAKEPPAWRRALRHGFVTLPRGMGPRLLVGVLISGGVSALVPEGFFAERLSAGFASYALALAVGIPMYVCSAASVPIAATFIHLGVSPGAAMVFLIAGPGVNAAGIVAMWKELGAAGTAAFLIAIAGVAVTAGALLDLGADAVRAGLPVVQAACGHVHEAGASPWAVGAAAVLLALLAPGVFAAVKWPHRRG
ncbi:MAG: SO_0444 family Cu/Zn efflux transporter [Verrucomicrobiota bacterium]|jgi:uncharacterized membrane protein YraQ (UPF0718 family)|nr:SO_0444 family Cu/Zn efflux transporter [Verrucomicrobiota bacterium]